MNELGVMILVPVALGVLMGSRRAALWWLAAGVLYLPQQQAVELVGINLSSTRICLALGLVRLLARRETRNIRLNSIDRAVFLVYAFTTVVFLLRSNTGQQEVIGNCADAVVTYLVVRGLLRDEEDLFSFLRTFALLLVPYVGLLAVETATGQNPFAALGAGFFEFREGRLRALGSFRNSSSLGTLGASFLPLYIALFCLPATRGWGFVGIVCCSAIVYFSNSGGPLAAAFFGVLAYATWSLKTHMQALRRWLVVAFFGLGLVMQAPIWYLPARISSLSGGGGWHRSRLLEIAADQVDRWWLAGMDLSATRHWFPYVLDATDSADITNNFLAFGIRAGAGAVMLLLLLLVRSFSEVGQAVHHGTDHQSALAWALGCVLVAHIASWFGISYFDQITVFWLLHMAMLSTLVHCRQMEAHAPMLRHAPLPR